MGKSTISMAIFNSYVKLPGGKGDLAIKHGDFSINNWVLTIKTGELGEFFASTVVIFHGMYIYIYNQLDIFGWQLEENHQVKAVKTTHQFSISIHFWAQYPLVN